MPNCKFHGTPMQQGRNGGWFCPKMSQEGDGSTANDKGYCTYRIAPARAPIPPPVPPLALNPVANSRLTAACCAVIGAALACQGSTRDLRATMTSMYEFIRECDLRGEPVKPAPAEVPF